MTAKANIEKGMTKQKFISFFWISGAGWLIAIFTLWALVNLVAFTPFVANAIGDFLAVSFVFFVSSYRTFFHKSHFLLTKFLFYLFYQACLITLISYLVQALSNITFPGKLIEVFVYIEVIAKIVVTPLTFLLNFLFSFFIFEKVGN